MTLWFDLSTSLGSSGMTGTVRTELELCRALQKKTKHLRFFRFVEGKIREVEEREAPWLFDLSRPIGAQYLKSRHQPRAPESKVARDAHLERIKAFATKAAPNALDRGRNSLLFALGMLPPAVAEAVIDVLGPHARATFHLMHRINGKLRARSKSQDSAPSETQAGALNSEHPFSDGDTVFTVGIDWALEFLPMLKRIREQTRIRVHQVVHDLTPIVVPQFHVERNCEVYREFFFNVATLVDCVWYISEQTRLDAEATQKRWQLPLVRSRQLTWGCDEPAHDTGTVEARRSLLAAKGITRPFVVFVSTVEVRKNHETIYRAYRQLLKDHGPMIPQLVFVGHGGWKRSEFLGALHRDPVVQGHLRHFSANEAELDALYRDCLFTVYPSLYEGWGLPIVESRTYGKPVIVSDSPSLKEAAGEGVDAVEALSVQAWRDILERYFFDPGYLEQVTQRQMQKFTLVSWAQTAEQVLAGIEQ